MTQTRINTESSEPYYDLDDDWNLIVASFQTQYGIRLARDLSSMSWREFSYLLNGLSGDTPLGRIVSIRAENDPEALKHFSKEEKRIRSEYRKKIAKERSPEECANAMEQFRQAFIRLAGVKNENTEM